MLWQELSPMAQSILTNFQHLISECVQHTHPDKNYYVETKEGDFYFLTHILFPLMNGVISFTHDPQAIDAKCELLKKRFKETGCPMTWFWPHDMALPKNVEHVFSRQGFQSMGSYTSVAAESAAIRKIPLQLKENVRIQVVKTDKQFADFMKITQEVYGVADEAVPAMARLYGAYQFSDAITLYLATVDNKSVSTLLSYQYHNTLGLYNGATLVSHRKQGLLTALMIHAVNNAPTADYAVSQLMAAQNARGVCDQLGFKEYSHFIPLCFGYDIDTIHA